MAIALLTATEEHKYNRASSTINSCYLLMGGAGTSSRQVDALARGIWSAAVSSSADWTEAATRLSSDLLRIRNFQFVSSLILSSHMVAWLVHIPKDREFFPF